jgi:zinc protease
MRVHLVPPSFVAIAALAAAQAKPAKVPDVEPRKWEHERSDLAPDPKISFGALKNGFRYAWINNTEPKKQIFLRLHVNIGSMVETEQELGIAHFVEHMAFNGTTNFKAGTLISTFNSQGIKFGHDVNAHTSMEETVYELDLPDGEPERLKKSFLWMRDVACGLKMEEKEIQAEKGVIDSEQRDRDSPGFRAFVGMLQGVLDGTLPPKRLPIGVQEVRAKFNSKLALAFYKRWYRPEHMTFVIAGDLGELDPTAMITQTFGTIPVPKDPLPARPDLGKPTFAKKGFSLDAGGSGGVITIARLRMKQDKPDDAKTRAASVPLQVAHLMASERFDQRQEKEKLPWNGVGSDQFEMENLVEGPCIQVHCTKEKWRESLMAAERELRRIVERGFTADELKKAYVRFDRTLVQRPQFPPPDSREYLQDVLRACNERYVPMEDKAGKEAYKPGIRGLTAEAASKAFKEAWGQGELMILAQGSFGLGADPAVDLFDVWNAAKATDLDQPLPVTADATAKAEKPAETGAGPSANGETADAAAEKKEEPEKKGDASKYAYAKPDVVKDETATANRMDDLKVVDLSFKNGVKASYRKNTDGGLSFGRWEVRVGEGELALDPARHEIAWVAERIFLAGGLGKNDWPTVQAAGGGVHFEVEGDACVFSGAALFGGDIKRPYEVICAYLTDPAFRQEAFDDFRKKLDEIYKEPEEGKENLGSLMRKFQEQLQAGEPRFQRPARAAVEAVTLEDVKTFLKGQLDGPIEIRAVGVDAVKLERALFSTFSKLPPRRAARDFEARRAIAPLKTGLKERHQVDTGEKSALIHMVYPATDRCDPTTARKLELLEDVVNGRLLSEIREKRGGAYSPRASVWGSDTWKGLGWVVLDVQVDPSKADELVKACALTMETLGTKGITQPELDRLRAAHLGDFEQQLKSDELWFDALRSARRRPQTFDEIRNFKATYEKITLADMNALCKLLFVKGKESVFLAVPKP